MMRAYLLFAPAIQKIAVDCGFPHLFIPCQVGSDKITYKSQTPGLVKRPAAISFSGNTYAKAQQLILAEYKLREHGSRRLIVGKP